jgi:hypothetical protein
MRGVQLRSPAFFSSGEILRQHLKRVQKESGRLEGNLMQFMKGDASPSPEVHPLIAGLAKTSQDSAAREYSLAALRVHFGFAPPDTLKRWPVRFFRMISKDRVAVWQDIGGRLTLREELSEPLCGPVSLLYPAQGLYDDLGLEQYFGDSVSEFDRAGWRGRLLLALELLLEFAGEIYNDLLQCVRCVVLIPPCRRRKRHSFSCRTSYYSVLFICVESRSPAEIAEDIIHEYYHQRFWGWWHLEGADDCLLDCISVLSPFTNRKRPFGTMLQAAYIFLSAFELRRLLTEVRDDAADRCQPIRHQDIRLLIRRLGAGRGIWALTDALLDHLQEEVSQ